MYLEVKKPLYLFYGLVLKLVHFFLQNTTKIADNNKRKEKTNEPNSIYTGNNRGEICAPLL